MVLQCHFNKSKWLSIFLISIHLIWLDISECKKQIPNIERLRQGKPASITVSLAGKKIISSRSIITGLSSQLVLHWKLQLLYLGYTHFWDETIRAKKMEKPTKNHKYISQPTSHTGWLNRFLMCWESSAVHNAEEVSLTLHRGSELK